LPEKELLKPPVDVSNRKLVLGISGGIAAYKCADLVRRLKERAFDVRVVMTDSAAEFITPMTLQAVSGNPVHQHLFDPQMEAAMGHIELARWADYLLIAPATANTIARLAHGEAGNLLTTLALATEAPLFVAPAMNEKMWANQKTKDNIEQLKTEGVVVFGPDAGEQACGDVGVGRMLEPLALAEKMFERAGAAQILAGRSVLITAGPTVEAIDPVRYISNHSSGKMGYALARQAQLAGAEVTLVSGPVNLSAPKNVHLERVTSAAEMLSKVQEHVAGADVFIGCAAVADYSPVQVAAQKIKKNTEQMTLSLKKNPDILAWVAAQSQRPFVVGFAAESQNLLDNARKKLTRKQLDLICANDISQTDLGFNSDRNQLLLLDKHGGQKLLKVAQKNALAASLISRIARQL